MKNAAIKQHQRVILLSILRAVHDGVKYPCGICDHQSTSKGNLTKHQRAVHDGVKFPCEECGHQETSKGNLAKHQRSTHVVIKLVNKTKIPI